MLSYNIHSSIKMTAVDEFNDDFDEIFADVVATETFCYCGSSNVELLVECARQSCEIRFYHSKCVELKTDHDVNWICQPCRGIETPDITKDVVKKKNPDVNSAKEGSVQSFVKVYTLDMAKDNAMKLILSSLTKLSEENYGELNSEFEDCLNKTISKFSTTDPSCIQLICEDLITHVWETIVAGDKQKGLMSTKFEKKASTFHQMRNSSTVKSCFLNLLKSIDIHTSDTIYMFITQFCLQKLFHIILVEKNCYEAGNSESKKKSEITLDKTDKNVLRYTSGYICRKLLRHFKRFPSNEIAVECCSVLNTFHYNDSNETGDKLSNVLAYTREWINIVNRGGLFVVSDDVFNFFYEMEVIVITMFGGSTLCDELDKNQIEKHIHNSSNVQNQFEILMKDTENEKVKLTLFTKFVSCWVNLRMKAFANLYIFVQKQDDVKLSKRSEKSLRREMGKENQKH